MKRLLLIVMLMPMIALAQESTTGIQWTTGLSWQQVQQKAKQENKYIFLDCFTTWCGPCKMMDKEVYVNDTVGDFFDQKFLSVKVQMDRTKNDNEYVKSWYSDVDAISRNYKIEGYPTFIFLSPTGNLVNMGLGFKKPDDFLSIAQVAVQPGQVYSNPYALYDSLVKQYNAGIKDYDQMPGMVKVALKTNQNDLAKTLLKDHLAYVLTLPKEKLYTKQNIEMWNSFGLSTKSKIFQLFYKDGKTIDKVMEKKGYSQLVIDKTINAEVVQPFFTEQNNNASIQMTGMILTDLAGKTKLLVDSSEADWQQLFTIIRKRFNTAIATRNVLAAKADWYKRHRNFEKSADCNLEYLNKYCSIETENPYSINNAAFEAFKYSTNKKVISGFIRWMGKVVENRPNVSALIDTYACLLYKAGKTKEAIIWEEKAANITGGQWAGSHKEFLWRVGQMKKGLAIWPYVRDDKTGNEMRLEGSVLSNH